MTFVHEVFSVVLLMAPADPATAHSFMSDTYLISTGNERRTQQRPALYVRPAFDVRSYAAQFINPFECSRFMLLPETRGIALSIYTAAATRSSPLLLPIKDALRLVTGYVGATWHRHPQLPTAIVMTGIRG